MNLNKILQEAKVMASKNTLDSDNVDYTKNYDILTEKQIIDNYSKIIEDKSY